MNHYLAMIVINWKMQVAVCWKVQTKSEDTQNTRHKELSSRQSYLCSSEAKTLLSLRMSANSSDTRKCPGTQHPLQMYTKWAVMVGALRCFTHFAMFHGFLSLTSVPPLKYQGNTPILTQTKDTTFLQCQDWMMEMLPLASIERTQLP